MCIINWIKSILYIFLLCFFQILIFNSPVFFGNYLYIYILFLIIYPYNWSIYMFLIFSFIIGKLIDFFMDTKGIHAFSMTLASFLRHSFAKFFYGNDVFLFHKKNVLIEDISLLKRIFYILSLVMVHHISLFSLEIFIGTSKLNQLFLYRTIISIVYVTILLILYSYFFLIKEKN